MTLRRVESLREHNDVSDLIQVGGSQENGMNHKEENGKISNGVKSGKYSLSDPSAPCAGVLHISFLGGYFANSTPCRTHRTRGTDAYFFSCTRYQRTCVGSRPSGQGHVDCLSPRAHQKSLIRIMFRQNARVTVLFALSVLIILLYTTSCTDTLLNTSMSLKPCGPPQGDLLVGRLAEQSLLPGSEANSLIEKSSYLCMKRVKIRKLFLQSTATS